MGADGGPAHSTRIVLLSLAEAESLRRALHTRHPSLSTPESPRVVLKLRDGRPLDFLQSRTLARLAELPDVPPPQGACLPGPVGVACLRRPTIAPVATL